MGTKYIIEVEDKPFELLSEYGFTSEKLYRVKGFNSLVFDWNGLNMLTPYTEPDLEQVRKEAYEQGLSDAWEAARKIVISEESGGLTCREMQRIFCTDETDEIFDMSASEVIEKIRQYEQKEQESITAEDVMRQYLDTFCRGRSCTGCILHTPDFTCGRGKYFLYGSMSDEEVRRAYAAVFAKMKEDL